MPRADSGSARPVREARRLLVLLLVLLVLLPATATANEDQEASRRLSRARDKEHDERNYEQALSMYRELLKEENLDAQIRGAALLGAARCHRTLEQYVEAESVWNEILQDPSLPVDVRERAEQARKELLAERSEVDPDVFRAEAQRRLDEQRRAKAEEILEQARRAHREGRYELARYLCRDALSWVPDSEEAAALLREIEEAMPDRTQLLRDLLRFAATTRIETFLRVKGRYRDLDREAREAFAAQDYARADERLREAIAAIDGSEFFEDLRNERAHAIRWLQMTIERGSEQGLELGPVPPVPELGAIAPSFQRRFFDLLSDVFTARPDEEDPLILYDVLPAPLPAGAIDQGLAAGTFAEGIAVTRTEGTLRRAAWAERWIRGNLGTGWTAPARNAPATGPLRLLDRFGDMLIVQHTRGVHAKVKELLDGFPTKPTPVAVDIVLVATTTPGGTRLAAALGARAEPRETGEDLVVRGRIVEECLPLLEGLEGVQLLGTARLTLGGKASATLGFTQPTDRHPTYVGLPPPPLVLDAKQARYGLWLEIYAEDLAGAAGARRAALGVRAMTATPQGTVVVPKRNAAGEWMRLPRPLAEQRLASDRVVPHAGALLLQGLTNPFPGSGAVYPGLVVLLGVRPAAVPGGAPTIPDPARPNRASERAGGVEDRTYELGPLAVEVHDEVLDRAWPQRPASVPVPAAAATRTREAYLARSLGARWAQLPVAAASAVTVRGRTATARLAPEQHARLEAAVARLRAQETALYRVDVVSAQTSGPELAEWLRAANAQAYTEGTYLASGREAWQSLDAELRALGPAGGLYLLQARLLARTTQKVAARNLHTLTILEDLKFWRHRDGRTQRQIPVLGTAEEGLVVLVRPELEADGKRLVIVEAQAARLQSLRPFLLPGTELQAATVTVPNHFPVQRRRAAVPLGDDEAIVLTVPVPERTDRTIVVLVRVSKVQ